MGTVATAPTANFRVMMATAAPAVPARQRVVLSLDDGDDGLEEFSALPEHEWIRSNPVKPYSFPQVSLTARLDFVERATRGCPCTRLGDKGERTAVEYRLDARREYLIVAGRSMFRGPEVRCPLQAVQDIYILQDGAEFFPVGVCARTLPEEQELLVMVVYGAN